MSSDTPTPTHPPSVRRWPSFGLGQLHRLTNARLEAALAAEHHSLRSYYVLASVHEEGNLSQQQVCDRVGVDRSDMVRLIDDLENRGVVDRTRDPRDRRRYCLTLSPLGVEDLKRCEVILATVTDDVLSALSTDERQTLHRLTLRALGQPEEPATER